MQNKSKNYSFSKNDKSYSQLRKVVWTLPGSIKLHNIRFQECWIKDNSISLIYTKPPYSKEFLHLYEDLAKQAARVLRDDASLLCYVDQALIPEVMKIMKKHGLSYSWITAVVNPKTIRVDYEKRIFVRTETILWFTKGTYKDERLQDYFELEPQKEAVLSKSEPWKSIVYTDYNHLVVSDYYVENLTDENDTVYDPFMAVGTLGASAKRLKRKFIGCEVDPGYFASAKSMISSEGTHN